MQLEDTKARMEGVYGSAKVTMSDGRQLMLEPGKPRLP